MQPKTYDYLSDGRQLMDRRDYSAAATMFGLFLQHVPESDVNSQYEALKLQAHCYEKSGQQGMADFTNTLASELEELVDSSSSSRLRLQQLIPPKKRA